MSEAPELAVDAADGALDALAQLAVGRHALAARRRDLDEHRLAGVRDAALEQLAEGLQADVDALGVVEPVDSEEDPARRSERFAQGGGGQRGLRQRRDRVELGEVDRDRERPDLDLAALVRDRGARRRDVDEPAADLQEVLRRDGPLKADEVRAEHPLDDLPAPRELHEELLRRQRDVQEEADPQIGPERAQHGRHEVQLVVVDPDRRALRGHGRGEVGEALVRLDVALPPLAAELGRAHGVVVERPQRAVREALVEALDLTRVEPDRRQPHAAVVERLRGRPGDPGPADPRTVPSLDDRRQRAHQPAWAHFPGAVVGPHDGEAVRDDDDLAGRRLPRAHSATVAPQPPRRARGLFVRDAVR